MDSAESSGEQEIYRDQTLCIYIYMFLFYDPKGFHSLAPVFLLIYSIERTTRHRRMEDKLDSLHLEMKLVQVLFDVSSTHGNRNLPYYIITTLLFVLMFEFKSWSLKFIFPAQTINSEHFQPVCPHGWWCKIVPWDHAWEPYTKHHATLRGHCRIQTSLLAMIGGVCMHANQAVLCQSQSMSRQRAQPCSLMRLDGLLPKLGDIENMLFKGP